jgi:hypothetical protein
MRSFSWVAEDYRVRIHAGCCRGPGGHPHAQSNRTAGQPRSHQSASSNQHSYRRSTHPVVKASRSPQLTIVPPNLLPEVAHVNLIFLVGSDTTASLSSGQPFQKIISRISRRARLGHHCCLNRHVNLRRTEEGLVDEAAMYGLLHALHLSVVQLPRHMNFDFEVV